MKTIASDESSAPKARDRASERTARALVGNFTPEGKIRHTEKLLCDLRAGMRNLRALRPVPFDVEKRALAQAAKIRSVETKLFNLRQMRLELPA